MDILYDSFFVSDGEFLAYSDFNENILYNIKTQETQQLQIDVDSITKIDDEYIYFTYFDIAYRCHINDLKNIEEVE